jgi:hypothetical protein
MYTDMAESAAPQYATRAWDAIGTQTRILSAGAESFVEARLTYKMQDMSDSQNNTDMGS